MFKVFKWVKDRRGSVDAVIGVVLVLATLMVGALIFTQLYSQAYAIANSTGDQEALNFLQNINSTGWSALQMLSIAAIVIAAVVIIGYLFRLRSGGGI